MPYLTCDDQINVANYVLELDGVETLQSPASIDPVTKAAHAWIDLIGVSVGKHIVRLQAKNQWGVSDWSAPFEFEKVLPLAPSGVGLREGP